MNMKVSGALFELFEASGWTQKKLAWVADMPQQSVSELLRGRKRLVPLTAIKLGAALGFDPMAMLMMQAGQELDQFDEANPGLADKVKERRDRLAG